jgi:hypothetical protein
VAFDPEFIDPGQSALIRAKLLAEVNPGQSSLIRAKLLAEVNPGQSSLIRAKLLQFIDQGQEPGDMGTLVVSNDGDQEPLLIGVPEFDNGDPMQLMTQIRPALWFSVEGFGCGEPDEAGLQGVQAIEEISP